MIYNIRRFIFMFICLFCCICTEIGTAAVVQPNDYFYVEDYASVLSMKTTGFMVEHSAALAEQTGAQIVVVTVKSLEGRDVMDYGLEILRNWGVGSEKNNGVVILVSTGDRKIGINVGYGLEGALNDSKVGRLIDTCAVPSLKEDDYDTGLYNLYNAVLFEVYSEYGLEVPENVKSLSEYESEANGSARGKEAAMIIAVIVLVVLLTINNKNRPGSGGGGGYYRRRGFYGGYGNFGGGFGGFRGGGGSGGGGGASRGF